MAKVKYLSRYADSQIPIISKTRAEAKKDYQKQYQANYTYKTLSRSLKQKIYQREYRRLLTIEKKRLKEVKEKKRLEKVKYDSINRFSWATNWQTESDIISWQCTLELFV